MDSTLDKIQNMRETTFSNKTKYTIYINWRPTGYIVLFAVSISNQTDSVPIVYEYIWCVV